MLNAARQLAAGRAVLHAVGSTMPPLSLAAAMTDARASGVVVLPPVVRSLGGAAAGRMRDWLDAAEAADTANWLLDN